jgi:ribosomal protein S18 acetylase RimI-like enzyme
MTEIRIVPFGAEHAAAFARLNRTWLEEHAILEPADEAQLDDPFGTIVARGGTILVALLDDVVVGTAAVLPHAPDEMELVKLTVEARLRGRGVGRRLVHACIEEARARSSHRLVLVSSSLLQSALRLYESLGFEHRPIPHPLAYETADVYMELSLLPDSAESP